MKIIIFVLSLILVFSFTNAQTSSALTSKISINYCGNDPGKQNYHSSILILNDDEAFGVKKLHLLI